MAPKRSNLMDDPPAASSEEDEATCSDEEEEDGEAEGSSSEEEAGTQTAKAVVKRSNPVAEQAESESETETESDSEDGPSSNVKPIASRPMEESVTKNAKDRSKPSVSTVAPGKLTAKRGNEVENDAKDSKRAKKDSESNGVAEKSEDAKKQLFQRLWSEDDEIVVLKGIIDFAEKKGIDPSKDMNSFCEFIKRSLHFTVALSQLKDKFSRLKKRFENHLSKGKSGEGKTFAKPHEQKLFDLSKRIWGKGGICAGSGESTVKVNGKAMSSSGGNNNNSRAKNLAALKLDLDENEMVIKKEDEMENHLGLKGIPKFDKRVDIQRMEDYVIKRGMDMVGGAKKAEMEEKWRDLHVAELELFLKRNELIKEQAELLLAGYKSMQD
ncbi:DNA-binding storekeeper protein-related transcriptional regulator [Euphorbia peplus]|nr:DNA-binding storekeeper protein-related transcriptional regulator [Euphorbia peplus]